MTTRALATLITNLGSSWGKDPKAFDTTVWFNEAFEMFDGVDVRILGAVVDEARTRPEVELRVLKERVRAKLAAPIGEPSDVVGYHRAEDTPMREDRMSVFNASLQTLRFRGPQAIQSISLGRSMMEKAKREGRLIDDEPMSPLFAMTDVELRKALAHLDEEPDRKI